MADKYEELLFKHDEVLFDLKLALNHLQTVSDHADEDCPAEYRTKHFRNALDRAVEFLDSSGWYDFNKEARSKK